MAIIKCPECGHQISDKAPVCLNCGVEIAGKIVKCQSCGEVFFKVEGTCPNCHRTVDTMPAATNEAATTNNAQETAAHGRPADKTKPKSPKGKNSSNRSVLITSVILVAIVLGVCAYVYNDAQSSKELEQYEFAMTSNDPMVLQSYLDNFKDAPEEHLDSIKEHLRRINAADQEWANAIVSGSKSALKEYLSKHPDSQHRGEALAKIDSIDWAQCSKTNTPEAYQLYIDNHMDGNHYDEAQLALKQLRSTQVTPEERQEIIGTFRQFFLSINEKDESTLTSTVSDFVNFLGKASATKEDIISFMHKLYKPEVENLIWSLSKDFKIDKREVGDGVYEYSVSFMANEKITKTDKSNATTQYRISAKIDPDGKISDLSMTKIVE